MQELPPKLNPLHDPILQREFPGPVDNIPAAIVASNPIVEVHILELLLVERVEEHSVPHFDPDLHRLQHKLKQIEQQQPQIQWVRLNGRVVVNLQVLDVEFPVLDPQKHKVPDKNVQGACAYRALYQWEEFDFVPGFQFGEAEENCA